MKTRKNIGRVVGVLLFVQLVFLAAGFIVLAPGITTDYLNAATGLESSIRIAVLCLFAGAAATLAITFAVVPVVRDHSITAALLLIAMGISWFVMQAVDNIHILSMLSLSQRYAEGHGANADQYAALAAQVRSTRVWAHFMQLLVMDVWYGTFFGLLGACRLIPRALAALALVLITVHLIGIPLAALAGYPVFMPAGYGMLVNYILIGSWMLISGFPERYVYGEGDPEDS